jgi:saccharopine dehydrogenase-like NADP-dependent oxidoreductase
VVEVVEFLVHRVQLVKLDNQEVQVVVQLIQEQKVVVTHLLQAHHKEILVET